MVESFVLFCFQQTTEIISGFCFIAVHNASTDYTKIIPIKIKLFFYLGWMQPISVLIFGCSVDPTVLVPKCFTHFVEGGDSGDKGAILVDTCRDMVA